jgi:hypothetical protein
LLESDKEALRVEAASGGSLRPHPVAADLFRP